MTPMPFTTRFRIRAGLPLAGMPPQFKHSPQRGASASAGPTVTGGGTVSSVKVDRLLAGALSAGLARASSRPSIVPVRRGVGFNPAIYFRALLAPVITAIAI